MGDEGTFWLDDLRLQALPPSRPANRSRARIANGSFEPGTTGGTPTSAARGRYEAYPDAREEIVARNLGNFESSTPRRPQGRKVLHWHNTKLSAWTSPPPSSAALWPPRHVAFSAKFGPPSKARATVVHPRSGEFGSTASLIHENLTFSDAAWHAFHFTVTPAPSADGRYYLEFMPAAWDSDFDLDA